MNGINYRSLCSILVDIGGTICYYNSRYSALIIEQMFGKESIMATTEFKNLKKVYCKGVCPYAATQGQCGKAGEGVRLVCDGRRVMDVCAPVFYAYVGDLWRSTGSFIVQSDI